MQYLVQFKKIKNNHNKLRDDVIEGTCVALPAVNEHFMMTSEPRDQDVGFRLISTSLVTKCYWTEDHNSCIIYTQSGSVYEISIQGEQNP